MLTPEEAIYKTTTLNKSYICSQVIRQLLFQAEQKNLEVLPGLTLALANGLTPDISVFPKTKIRPNFFQDIECFEQMPILAIEIISPSKHIERWLKEAKCLAQAGAKSVWTIEPFSHSIWVTNEKGTKLFHNTAIESEGIAVDFQKIFGSDISLSA